MKRTDGELLCVLHVLQRWTVRAGGAAFQAQSLDQALRLARRRLRSGGEIVAIETPDGSCRIDVDQALRLCRQVAA